MTAPIASILSRHSTGDGGTNTNSIPTYTAANYLPLDGKHFSSVCFSINDKRRNSATVSKLMVYPRPSFFSNEFVRSIFVVILERGKISTTGSTDSSTYLSLPLLLLLRIRNEEISFRERFSSLRERNSRAYSFSRKKRSERRRKEGREEEKGRLRSSRRRFPRVSFLSLSLSRSFFFSGHAQERSKRGAYAKSKEGRRGEMERRRR